MVSAANVGDVAITCINNTYTIGGAITGLSGTVELQTNNGGRLTLSDNGRFSFTTEFINGQPYEVTVLVDPAGQLCIVTNGSGTIILADIDDVIVSCSSAPVLAESQFNEALFATPTVSSTGSAADQFEANDGIKGSADNGWVTSEANPWIRLDFDSPKDISKIALADLPGSQNVLDAVVDFSDGSSLTTGILPDGGTPKEFTFATKRVDWLRVTITSANQASKGLAEIEAFADLGAQSKLAEDLFNDGDASGWVVTDNCQSGSSSWQVVSDPLLVVKNMYTQTSGCRSYTAPEGTVLGTYAVLNAVTHNDVDVRLRVRSNFNGSFLQAGTIGLMFGHQDNNNYYRLDLSQRSGHRKLMKRVGGVFTELATSPQSYTPGEWTNVRIVRQNGVIIVFVNGEQALTAEDSTFSSGKLALFCAQNTSCLFDNVFALSAPASPLIGLTAPSEFFVETGGVLDVAAVVTAAAGMGGVEFVVDEGTVNELVQQDLAPPYSAAFDFFSTPGEHTVHAYLLSDDGIPVRLTHAGAADETMAAVNGIHIVTMGDSLTEAIGDGLGAVEPADDTSADQRNTSGGYQPVLNDYLTSSNGVPVTVLASGNPGEKSAGGVARIAALLARTVEAQAYLVQYGANDSSDSGGATPVPSGFGLHPGDPGYAGSFKHNMQQIIDAVVGAGKQIFLAKTSTLMVPIPGPDYNAATGYNAVIDELIDEHFWSQVPPDFLAHFQDNMSQMGSDNIHPTGEGYHAEAGLWCDSLNGQIIDGRLIYCSQPP